MRRGARAARLAFSLNGPCLVHGTGAKDRAVRYPLRGQGQGATHILNASRVPVDEDRAGSKVRDRPLTWSVCQPGRFAGLARLIYAGSRPLVL